MKILLLTNLNGDIRQELYEDIMIAQSLINNGHKVTLSDADSDEALDDFYDVFIKRNTWGEEPGDVEKYWQNTTKISQRLRDKKCVNLNGLFDNENGKTYLVDLYRQGLPVIPSSYDFADLPVAEKYLLKPIKSYDGIDQKVVDRFAEIPEGYLVQPKMDFVCEVQFYFVGTKFEYAQLYSPSKVPDYPDPEKYQPTETEMKMVQEIANLNKDLIGVQRLDFLKLKSGELLLMEIEDGSPHLGLSRLDEKTLAQFLTDYKNMINSLEKK